MTEQAGARKITISLAHHLLDYADHAAKAANVSRSQIISDAVAEAKARADEALAAEGYRYYAAEAEDFAAASASAVAEAVDNERQTRRDLLGRNRSGIDHYLNLT